MKTFPSIILILTLMLSADIKVYSDNDKLFPLLDTDEFQGVVIPTWYDLKYYAKGDKKGYWTPSLSYIQKAEKAIEQYLESLKIPEIPNPDPSISEKKMNEIFKEYSEKLSKFPLDYESLEYIKKNLKKSRRQYIGLTVDGEKRIFCNFFPGIQKGKKDHFSDWRKHLTGGFDIDGGGASFWTIEYCIKEDKCINLKINAPE